MNDLSIEDQNPNLYEFLVENKIDKMNFNTDEFQGLKLDVPIVQKEESSE